MSLVKLMCFVFGHREIGNGRSRECRSCKKRWMLPMPKPKREVDDLIERIKDYR